MFEDVFSYLLVELLQTLAKTLKPLCLLDEILDC